MLYNRSISILLLFFIFFYMISNANCSVKRPVLNIWCKTKHCQRSNIACEVENYNFSTSCPAGAKIIAINRYSKLILILFNNFRNLVASGTIQHFFMAGRMAKMVWSKQLEFLAEINLKQCALIDNRCMSSSEFAYIGQNSGQFSYSGSVNQYSNYEIIKEMIEKWFERIVTVDRDMCLYMPETLRNPETATVTIAISERNTHIGCAGLRYTIYEVHTFQFTCAFSTDNIIHKPLYHAATSPGLRCKRRDREYKYLCDTTEKYENDVYSPAIKIYGFRGYFDLP